MQIDSTPLYHRQTDGITIQCGIVVTITNSHRVSELHTYERPHARTHTNTHARARSKQHTRKNSHTRYTDGFNTYFCTLTNTHQEHYRSWSVRIGPHFPRPVTRTDAGASPPTSLGTDSPSTSPLYSTAVKYSPQSLYS